MLQTIFEAGVPPGGSEMVRFNIEPFQAKNPFPLFLKRL